MSESYRIRRKVAAAKERGRQMANVRWQKERQKRDKLAAKERKRQQAIADGWTPMPKRGKVILYPNLSWAMRDDLSGEVFWMEFKSVRDMAKRAGMVARYYSPVTDEAKKLVGYSSSK